MTIYIIHMCQLYKISIIEYSEIINGTPVFSHFIFDTLVFFQLSMVPQAFNANYNCYVIQVVTIILLLNPF